MTNKIERRKKAKRYRKLFKVDFVASFKAAKSELSIDLVHPSLERHNSFYDCQMITRVIATDGRPYTFVDGFLY